MRNGQLSTLTSISCVYHFISKERHPFCSARPFLHTNIMPPPGSAARIHKYDSCSFSAETQPVTLVLECAAVPLNIIMLYFVNMARRLLQLLYPVSTFALKSDCSHCSHIPFVTEFILATSSGCSGLASLLLTWYLTT